ncbi:MAG TPA: DUF4198 domain-containing protein [Gemmataceae bacterium]|nr:DUF4198 domain-containing protein [Gemmataceae bacterium]
MTRLVRPGLLGVPLLVAALGCGGGPYKVAPVSGTVTLDGKPLANAWVTFMPVGTKDNPDPGPTAAGKTDAQGKFTLAIEPGRPGAVVGKHKVAINSAGGDEKGGDRDAGGPRGPREKLPDVYNYKTTLTFDVPPEGTETANFELKSRP